MLQSSALTNVKLQKKKYNQKKAEVMKVNVREWTFPTAVSKESKSRLANRKQYLTVHKPKGAVYLNLSICWKTRYTTSAQMSSTTSHMATAYPRKEPTMCLTNRGYA